MCSVVTAQEFEPLFGDWGDWQFNNTEREFFTLMREDGDTVLRVSGDRGWVQSAQQYGDFILRGEFRFLEADADSGIFLRVEPGTDFIRGWPGDAYQVQIREITVNTGDNPLPLLNLYRHRVADGVTEYDRERVFARYTGVGEWQRLVVEVVGDTVTASLNGDIVMHASDLENTAGYMGFQSEKGVIEYRNLEIYAR